VLPRGQSNCTGTTGSVPRGRGVALPSGETVAVAASVTDRQTDRHRNYRCFPTVNHQPVSFISTSDKFFPKFCCKCFAGLHTVVLHSLLPWLRVLNHHFISVIRCCLIDRDTGRNFTQCFSPLITLLTYRLTAT